MTRHVLGLRGCSRCGGDHGPIDFLPLARPISRKGVVTHTHWAPCPTNGEPILMIEEADDVPAEPDIVVPGVEVPTSDELEARRQVADPDAWRMLL